MRSCVLLVVGLSLCCIGTGVLARCDHSDVVVTCTCDANTHAFDSSEITEAITPKSAEFILSLCDSVELTSKTFINAKNITSIRIDSIKKLNLNTILPSNLEKLHLTNVNLEVIEIELFSNVSYLKQLVVENSVVSFVKPTALSEVFFASVAFKNVTFERLTGKSLDLHFDTKETTLAITDCSFHEIGGDGNQSIITSNSAEIIFTNNALKCDNNNLMLTYAWLVELFQEKMRKNKTIICGYLTQNYCGENKTQENRIINRLMNDQHTSDTGLQLDKTCAMKGPEYPGKQGPSKPTSSAQYSTVTSWVLTAVLAGILSACSV